jgi:hypothetical protein
MGKLFSTCFLILFALLCCADVLALEAGPQRDVEKCQVYSSEPQYIAPACFADMHMIASRPALYCNSRVILFGYLDYGDAMLFPSKEQADAGFIDVSAIIAGEAVTDALRKFLSPRKRGDYVTLTGQFRCASEIKHWSGTGIGEIFDVEIITHYDRKDRYPKERVIYRVVSTRKAGLDPP